MRVTNSQFRSAADNSEGIELVAGDTNEGRASFNSVTLESPSEKILLAQICDARSIVGAPAECGPLTDADFTE